MFKFFIILLITIFQTSAFNVNVNKYPVHVARDLTTDIQIALDTGIIAINATSEFEASLSGVDSILITQVEVLVVNIILNLFQLGVNSSDLLNLQIIIDHAEAVIVYQVYEQTRAVRDYNEILANTQTDLINNNLNLIQQDRNDIFMTLNELNNSLNAALIVIQGEHNAFNNEVFRLIQGLSGPEVTEIQLSVIAINTVLSDTKDDLTLDKMNMDTTSMDYITALDIIIPQIPIILL